MIHRLLIVEDELPLREGLAAYDWEKVGFRVVGALANGEEALDFLARTEADVLLTDIRMPFVDGLELCRRAKLMQPSLRMLLLSGHRDFEYAKAAIRLGVTDYLLKPLDLDVLNKVFLDLDADLNEKAEEKESEPLTDESTESALLPVIQAVLDGYGTVAGKLFLDFCRQHLSPASYADAHALKAKVRACLVRIGAEIATKIEKVGAQGFDPRDPPLRCEKREDLMNEAEDYLCRLSDSIRSSPKTLSWAYVQKALAFIHLHLADKISMSQVAEAVALSESYFSQIFKKETGVNFVDYLRDRRIGTAIDLMWTTELKIYQIGARVGYDDAAYFALTFRRCTGYTPLDYKRRFILEGL